ncbi:RtcB family protein [Cereibacter sphaeroides]|uniref:RtcB family protein n=1 Tax=Cereibacter sphaeroides TaxID=1063 RepID=UPI001F1F520C|nr:RtcB family protein [Cereibacter sphaeroides]MCE6958714.1 RtcB family protein [Cereibacter sphaeroides]MCE6971202.1 RtcB family protein [Cereibacter sphaeroides]
MSAKNAFKGVQDLLEAGYEKAPWFHDVIRTANKQRMNREQALRVAARFHAEYEVRPPAEPEVERFSARDLVMAGHEPAPWFDGYIAEVERRGLSMSQALKHAPAARQAWLDAQPKTISLQEGVPIQVNMTAEDEFERQNMELVVDSFRELARTPTVLAGAIMPDACMAGSRGSITVGGVIGAKGAIHPGMHSADVCCSMFVTVLDTSDADRVLDAAAGITHFGPTGRTDGRFTLPRDLEARFRANPLLDDGRILRAATVQLGSQGDGNHFFYVGRMADDRVAIVTHHGSRGVGGMLYKKGMRIAEDFRERLSPETLKANAWIPIESKEGEAYWEALQITRAWTKENHRVLHDAVADELGLQIDRRLWNEHNFVFREDDVFWHAKGATPIHNAFLPDTEGVQIVPMNMAQPILLVSGERTATNLGFAPHGAGRNLSRTQHKRLKAGKTDAEIFAEETAGIDARFFCNRIDISELPSAYKDADSVQRDMERFGLCRVVERIQPYGCVMAGDIELEAPWRKKRPEVNDREETYDEPEVEEDEDAAPGF